MSRVPGATLIIDGVTKSFRREPAGAHAVIRAMSFEAAPGSLVLVEGDPGSGRSTLLRCIVGTYRIDSGSVVIQSDAGSVDLANASDRTVAWIRERYVSVFDGQLLAPPHIPAWRVLARSARLGEGDARERLQRVGLDEYCDVAIGRLRRPETRLLALTTALARRTSFYLLDDPLLDQHEPIRAMTIAAMTAALERDATVVVTASPDSPLHSLATKIHRLDSTEEHAWHSASNV